MPVFKISNEGDRMNISAASKRMKDQLLQENDYLKSIFMTMNEGLIITDGDGVIQKINNAVEEMLGYTEAELIGKHFVVLSAEPYAIGKKPSSIEKLFAEGSIKQMEARYKKKDGTVFYAEVSSRLLKSADGAVMGAIGVFRDLTKNKQVEKKLFESEELFRLSFENAPVGICIFDKNGVLLQANRFCEECFGRSRDDIMRQGFPMFLHPDDRDKTTQALLSLANNPETNERLCVLENRYFSADGRTIYTKQHIQGYYDEAGSLFLVIVLTEDITTAQQLRLSNQSVISKLKEVHSQLKEFNDLLPDSKKFLSVKALSDYGFSSMENRIAAMISIGHTNKKIAQQFCISENTVKHHITSMYTKCRVKNRIGFINLLRTNRIAI